ncbi:hypothetical protein BV898_08408 [Hypsibius exemplaris]|uniref:MYND-type domain-containing protein n=1 Tax=Hypsibius exemplaris TaxID=2072580 RepID=A0A1W0WQJ9_HYPEX|nr:hypothetical protein BV898_08408 [Hypsibius exemplaris]
MVFNFFSGFLSSSPFANQSETSVGRRFASWLARDFGQQLFASTSLTSSPMASPDIAPEARYVNRGSITPTSSLNGSSNGHQTPPPNNGSSSLESSPRAHNNTAAATRNLDLTNLASQHIRSGSSSTQRMLVLLSNLRTDPYCWMCHSMVGESISVRCIQCRRLFHKPCWTSHVRSAATVVDETHGSLLPDSCLECLAIADENARRDNILSRVGMPKLRTFLLYMLHFVEEKLEKENAGPFAKSRRHPADCDEALCPAALLRLKMKVADGQYTTYAQFLADLRGLLHKSIVIHGEDSGYSKAANYVLESCMQLCNSMDWCEECFERSLPRPGETIIAAILRSLVNPCSKLHVVVCIKMLGKMWPALVYRFDGEFVNVRFFGTLEFGRVHKSSVFLLYEKFELNMPVGELQQQRTGSEAAYEYALRQCRLHIAKLLLIPECSVQFSPKVTAYDGRLFMQTHSTQQTLFTNSPSTMPILGNAAAPINSPRLSAAVAQKRHANGTPKSPITPDLDKFFSELANNNGGGGGGGGPSRHLPSGLQQQASKRPHLLPTTSFPSLSSPDNSLRARTDVPINAMLHQVQQQNQTVLQASVLRGNGTTTAMEGVRAARNRSTSAGKGLRHDVTTANSPRTKAFFEGFFNGIASSGVTQNSGGSLNGTSVINGSSSNRTAPESPNLRPSSQQTFSSSSSRKSAEPKRFPSSCLSDQFAKKSLLGAALTSNNKAKEAASPNLNPFSAAVHAVQVIGQSNKSMTALWQQNGVGNSGEPRSRAASSSSSGEAVRAAEGGGKQSVKSGVTRPVSVGSLVQSAAAVAVAEPQQRERARDSPSSVGVMRPPSLERNGESGSPSERGSQETDPVQVVFEEPVVVFADEGPMKGVVTVTPRPAPDVVVESVVQKFTPPLASLVPATVGIVVPDVQKQLVELFHEMAKAAEVQQKLMDRVQQDVTAVGNECLKKFAEAQERLETMCQNQLRESQQMFGTASSQLQAIAQWVSQQGSSEPEAMAYKRGRQDALRNRANWIDKTKQSFWCCVCRNPAHMLCCGVTLYCSEDCQSADYSQHRQQCRRQLSSDFEDPVIHTPYGDLSVCQTFPQDDLNPPSPVEEDDEDHPLHIDVNDSSLEQYDTDPVEGEVQSAFEASAPVLDGDS